MQENSVFLCCLHDVLQKVLENNVLFTFFRDTLKKVRIECMKTASFEHFARRSAKRVRKHCFSRFL